MISTEEFNRNLADHAKKYLQDKEAEDKAFRELEAMCALSGRKAERYVPDIVKIIDPNGQFLIVRESEVPKLLASRAQA